MIADSQRLRVGDNVIFYLLQTKFQNRLLGEDFMGFLKLVKPHHF